MVRFWPGFVAVEHEDDAVDEPLQDLDVGFAQGHAEHGHGVVEAELVGDDDVGIALHHQGGLALALMDGLLGQIEAVQQMALAEQRGFRRVDVLAREKGLDAGEQPPAHSHRPALGIADGEQAAAAEQVVKAAARGRAAEHADRLQDLGPAGAAAGLLEDPIAIQRGEAELEAFDALGRDAALLKILSGRLGLGRVQEALVILALDPGGRLVERSLVDAAEPASG